MRMISEIDFALPNLLSFNDSTFRNIDALTPGSYISRSRYITSIFCVRQIDVDEYELSLWRSVLKELDYIS